MDNSLEIFEHTDYLSYLRSFENSWPRRGFRSVLAEASQCQNAYITRIFSGEAHFSLEQAERVFSLLGLTGERQRYFLLLVEHARAGTPGLRKIFLAQIHEIQQARQQLKNRIPAPVPMDIAAQTRYFSHWYYAAVHVLVSIPELQSRSALQERLGLGSQRLSEILEFLVSVGLVHEEGGRFDVGVARLHIGHDSPLVQRHHANWRLRALADLDRDEPSSLHYSSIVTLSRADFEKVRSKLLHMIEGIKSAVKDSVDEKAAVFALDWFEM